MILDHKIVFLYLNLYCDDSHMLSGSLPPAALCEPINILYNKKIAKDEKFLNIETITV